MYSQCFLVHFNNCYSFPWFSSGSGWHLPFWIFSYADFSFLWIFFSFKIAFETSVYNIRFKVVNCFLQNSLMIIITAYIVFCGRCISLLPREAYLFKKIFKKKLHFRYRTTEILEFTVIRTVRTYPIFLRFSFCFCKCHLVLKKKERDQYCRWQVYIRWLTNATWPPDKTK